MLCRFLVQSGLLSAALPNGLAGPAAGQHQMPAQTEPQGLLRQQTSYQSKADEVVDTGAEDEADSELDDVGAQSDESMQRLSTGVGPAPTAMWPGRYFNGADDFMNLKDDDDSDELRVTSPFGGFSFYAEVRFDALRDWNRIFDFGDNDFHHTISAGTIGDTPYLFFEVHNSEKRVVRTLQVRDAKMKVGATHKFLFTINEKGMMRVWMDGVILKEASGDPPDDVDRPYLYIGKANFKHHGSDDMLFHGMIKDIRLWHQEVDWNTVLKAVGAANWPGLVNGDFDSYPVPWGGHDSWSGVPPAWMAALNERSSAIVYLKKHKLPPEPAGEENKTLPVAGAYAALKGEGAVLVQDVSLLTKDQTYWMAFRAKSREGKEGNLRVSVDGVPFLDQMRFTSEKFSTQMITFPALRFDGKATISFENVSPDDHVKDSSTIYIDDIRISPVPHCYRLWKWNSYCPQSSSDQGGLYKGLTGMQCRQKCEEVDCHFMLFDPVSFSDDRHSICDIYMQCKEVAVFYGGKFGSIYQRIPCAMGGTLFEEMAVKYPLPELPEGFWKTVPGVDGPPNPDDLPGAPAHRRRRAMEVTITSMPIMKNGVEYTCPPEEVKKGFINITHCNLTHPGPPKHVKLPCSDDLVGHGLGENQFVRDDNITASSYYEREGKPETKGLYGMGEMWRSRILEEVMGDPRTSWRANFDNPNQWIQWDFGMAKFVKQIETQAAAMNDPTINDADWVTKYRIEYFEDGLWKQYNDGEELTGNKRPEDINVEVLKPPFLAESVRLIPTQWHNHVSMRAGMIGCGPDDPAFPHPGGTPPPKEDIDDLIQQNLSSGHSLAGGTSKIARDKDPLKALKDELTKLHHHSEDALHHQSDDDHDAMW